MRERIALHVRETIIELHKDGFCGAEICRRLGEKVSVRCVNKIIKRYKTTGSV